MEGCHRGVDSHIRKWVIFLFLMYISGGSVLLVSASRTHFSLFYDMLSVILVEFDYHLVLVIVSCDNYFGGCNLKTKSL